MPEGQMQRDATVACPCVQHVMSQHAMSQMCWTELMQKANWSMNVS